MVIFLWLLLAVMLFVAFRITARVRQARKDRFSNEVIKGYETVRRIRWALYHSRWNMASARDRGCLLHEDQDAIRILDLAAKRLTLKTWGELEFDDTDSSRIPETK